MAKIPQRKVKELQIQEVQVLLPVITAVLWVVKSCKDQNSKEDFRVIIQE